MAYVQKPCTGSLWPNDRKTDDRHPDHSGTIVLPDGTECFLDAWLKTTKGTPEKPPREYLSLSIKPKNLQRQPPAERPQQARPALPQRPQSRPAPPPRRPPAPAQPAQPSPEEDPLHMPPDADDIPF